MHQSIHVRARNPRWEPGVGMIPIPGKSGMEVGMIPAILANLNRGRLTELGIGQPAGVKMDSSHLLERPNNSPA